MKRITPLIIILSIFLSGCASMKYNYYPQREKYDFPHLNVETTVNIGDSILIQCDRVTSDYLLLHDDCRGINYTIPSGLYKQTGFDEKHKYFSKKGSSGDVRGNPLADPVSGLLINTGIPNELRVISIYGTTISYSASYDVIERTNIEVNSKQMELIYSGRIKDKLRFTYVETGTQYRPSISHEIEYDLSRSDTIGYRGARIQVLNATNEQITYKVLQNFRTR